MRARVSDLPPMYVPPAVTDSGQAGGLAFVDVLLNEPEGPSGKLTTTWMKPEQVVFHDQNWIGG